MKSLTLVSLAALAVGSSASTLKPRNISNNNCGRAVAGTAKGPAFQSSAKADCSKNVIAYTTIVVTPSASTLTITSSVSATALATVIITNTASTTVTSDVLSTETDQYVSTAYSTSTDIETVIVTENSTPPAVTLTIPVTVTAVTSSTVTSYYATVSAAGAAGTAAVTARGVEERDEQVTESGDEEEDCDIDARDVKASSSSAVPAKTTASSVSGIPSYAAACTDFAQYAAACSLLGVYQTTSTMSSTLSASTVTVTAFSTLTTTLVATSSTELDLSFTTFETLVSTTIESSTLVLSTATTAYITAYTTQIAPAATVTVSPTVTVTGPASIQTVSLPVPKFKLLMTPVSGTGTTYFVNIVGSSLGYTGTTNVNYATVFTIDTAGRMVTVAAAPVVACAYNTLANYYLEAIPYAYLDTHASTFTALKCAISGTAQVTCAYNSATTFEYVPSQNSFWYTSPNYYTSQYPPYVAHAIPV